MLDGAYTFDILHCVKRMRWTSGANVVHKYDCDSMTCAGRDRLSAVATEGTPAETYGYDYPGRCALNSAVSFVNWSIYNGFHVIADVDATAPLVRSYAYGHDMANLHVISVYGYRFYSPGLGRFVRRDPMWERGGINLYCFVQNEPVRYVDKLGLAPFVNNCGRPIPFKPEDDLDCGVKEDKKYDCAPGMTCDVDGVYPPDGGNPFKIVNGCRAECNTRNGRMIMSVSCDDLWSAIKQRLGGGFVPDEWWTPEEDGGMGHGDWPTPSDPSFPLPECYNPFG